MMKIRNGVKMTNMAVNQLLLQVYLHRAGDGAISTSEPVEGDGPAALKWRFESLLSILADTERSRPLFQSMVDRLEVALEVMHPKLTRRLRMLQLLSTRPSLSDSDLVGFLGDREGGALSINRDDVDGIRKDPAQRAVLLDAAGRGALELFPQLRQHQADHADAGLLVAGRQRGGGLRHQVPGGDAQETARFRSHVRCPNE